MLSIQLRHCSHAITAVWGRHAGRYMHFRDAASPNTALVTICSSQWGLGVQVLRQPHPPWQTPCEALQQCTHAFTA